MLPLEPPPADTPPIARPAAESPTPAARPARTATAATPPPALNAPPGLEAFTRALTHRLKFVLIFGLSALVLGAAAGWVLTPNRYIAQGHIQLSNRGNQAGGNDEFLNFQRTQMTILKSHTILRRTLSIPDVADLREVLAHGDLNDQIEWLQKDLILEPVLGNAEVLRLSLSGRRPDDLANLLNKLMDVYVDDSRTREQARLNVLVKQMEDTYRDAENDLFARRGQLRKEEIKYGLEDQKLIPEQIQRLDTERNSLVFQKNPLDVEFAKVELTIKTLQANLNNPNGIPVSSIEIQQALNQDKGYTGLKDNYAKLEAQMLQEVETVPESQRPRVLENYRVRLKTLDGQLVPYQEKARRDLIQVEVERIKKSLAEAAVTRTVLHEQLVNLNSKIDPLTTKIDGLRDKVRGPGRIIPEVEGMRDRVAQVERDLNLKGTALLALKGELAAAGRASVLESAMPPTDQKIDKKLKVSGMVGLSLFGLTFLGIAFTEYRTRRIYTPDDVTRGLGIPMVGALPLMPLAARLPLLGPNGTYLPEQGPLLEAVDALRTILLRAAQTDDVHIVMVTSAGGGEGKTTLAGHLAASLARGWRNTLLIDADLRHPAAAAQFGLPDSPGLSELLRGEVTADDAIRPTTLPRLALLPAGRCDANTLQALAQEEVGNTLGHLKEDYDFIIIDVSPVLPVPDALMIGQHADAVILSVLRNVSRLPAVYAAQQRLASIDIPILGAVVIGDSVDAYGINPYPLRSQG